MKHRKINIKNNNKLAICGVVLDFYWCHINYDKLGGLNNTNLLAYSSVG